MKVLILTPYPFGKAASQRFRFEQYLELLKEKGIDYTISPFYSEKTFEILYQKGYFFNKFFAILFGLLKRKREVLTSSPYDYIFIHREVSPIGPPYFEWFLARVMKKKIIYDFDDAIWLKNASDTNRIFAFMKTHANVAKICRYAYKVSCGNNYLCNFAKEFNSQVILNPTTIDTENHHNSVKQHVHQPPVIGWTGTHSTIRYLDDLIPVLQELSKKYDFEFRVISDLKVDYPLKNFTFIPWKKATEIEDLMQFDIGVMPLSDDPWSKGKCGFKALQYMALGIPALASPVGVNASIIDHGVNGFLCANNDEWYAHLEQLLQDSELIQHMGKKARPKIEQSFSVLSNSNNFLHLFT